MNNQEELQKAFIQFLVQDAAQQGIQLQSEQDLQEYAKQLGEDGIKAKYEEFMQAMQQQSIKAQLGAKLTYYKHLKGSCPDGEEPTFLQKGGRICKTCQKKKLMQGQTMNPIEEFKNKRKVSVDKCGSKMKKKKK